MAYDNTDGGVITMDILEEGDDEISRTLGFFISFVHEWKNEDDQSKKSMDFWSIRGYL